MPAIITPPEIDRRSRRLEEHDGGNGRRPPNGGDLKRTGGGGDNDGWNDAARSRRRPGDRLATYRLGLFFALGAVFMFFVGIVVVFFLSQTRHADVYNAEVLPWLPTEVPPILWLNTGALIISSLTMEIARRRMFHQIDAMEEWFGLGRPTSRRALPWLLATILFGGLFLAGQMTAWRQLSIEGVPFASNSTSGHSFYIMTYAHAAHLAFGVMALFVAIIGLFRFRKIENRQIMVDCVGWYWHSMGILWGCLFFLLTCCQ